MSSARALAVIPARYASTRFPGKPLAPIGGVPMILRVLERTRGINNIDEAIVATDDRRIAEVVEKGGGRVVMTSRSHSSGTSRVAEAASGLDYDIVINIQGDEPLLPVRGVEELIEVMASDSSVQMGTLASISDKPEMLKDRDIVKVVFDLDGNALYFSRAPLPGGDNSFYRHIGIYGFRLGFLMKFSRIHPSPLEMAENLEQLRALENGYRIRVVTCDGGAPGVDRPEDIKRVEKLIDKI
ncbi:MAG: 3-deoxy-manno-octulosonate cytidylyltransferase [Candidatus Latescibacteria bacterium]|nr:3-deoxy-manno-octulosonate cytidylyltransferase [bacterium]MBD3424989.1 3-deoxy-manno-octulosonate cytidylyltransferase [Candidatus Latescibacterota bacterium]